MGNLKHTKGEWRIEENCWADNHVAINGDNWDCFAMVVTKMDGALEKEKSIEGEANARLIAAAPEMLECLIEIYKNSAYHQHNPKTIKLIEKATGLSIEEVLNNE